MASTDKIHLDLNAVEREETYEPFVFDWKGRVISLSDPAELDFRQLLEVETPIGFLRFTASQADRDFLASDEGRMESWRLNKLIEAYYKHFGIDPGRSKLGI
jgi:hypothetical protein